MRIGQSIDIIQAARKLQGRMKFQDMDISIENRAGSVRRGVDPDGNEWATKMHIPYGYIRKTEGADGDHVDCFIGPDKQTNFAYIIHIKNPKTGEYDEDKVFLGAYNEKHARKLFDKHYDNPEKFYQGMTVMRMDDFKKKVLDKENHGQQIAADNFDVSNVVLDPIPTFHPPSKRGKSRVPVDSPTETDNSLLDLTKREEAIKQREKLIESKAKPYPIGTTAVQHQQGGTNEYLNPRGRAF